MEVTSTKIVLHGQAGNLVRSVSPVAWLKPRHNWGSTIPLILSSRLGWRTSLQPGRLPPWLENLQESRTLSPILGHHVTPLEQGYLRAKQITTTTTPSFLPIVQLWELLQIWKPWIPTASQMRKHHAAFQTVAVSHVQSLQSGRAMKWQTFPKRVRCQRRRQDYSMMTRGP